MNTANTTTASNNRTGDKIHSAPRSRLFIGAIVGRTCATGCQEIPTIRVRKFPTGAYKLNPNDGPEFAWDEAGQKARP